MQSAPSQPRQWDGDPRVLEAPSTRKQKKKCQFLERPGVVDLLEGIPNAAELGVDPDLFFGGSGSGSPKP